LAGRPIYKGIAKIGKSFTATATARQMPVSFAQALVMIRPEEDPPAPPAQARFRMTARE
jgi:hypothetical protein